MVSENEQRVEELIAQIDSAFDGVVLGEGIGLWESDGIDDYCGKNELQALRAKDEKIDWRKIPVEHLSYCNAAPSFLDARGLYFHLPAFLTAELRHEIDVGFIDRLIFDSFGAPDFKTLLTPSQRHAIIACISFCGSKYESCYDAAIISEAIMRYSLPEKTN